MTLPLQALKKLRCCFSEAKFNVIWIFDVYLLSFDLHSLNSFNLKFCPIAGFGDGGVRLQWDPDHDPHGAKQTRRAVQLGLKGDILKSFNNDWIRDISDITDFVKEQRQFVLNNDLDSLVTPRETVFVPQNADLCRHVQIDVDDT